MHAAVASHQSDQERSSVRLRVIRPALPKPGDTIAGKYRLVRIIGEGGMGIVYEAAHLRLRQRLAIKVLRPDLPEFDEVVARFEREARAAAQLQSIHTARVIDVDTLPSGLPYIVLEFLDGRDLDAELEGTGAMAVQDAVDIVLQAADAMSEAHALGIVHRDLKPSNLFVCRVEQRARRVVKVLDFGISKVESDDSKLTPTHEYFGTPYYAAPEQLRAASMADARSDVWSLGAILFELLTGRTPFVGTPTSVITKVVSESVPWPTELRPDLPRELARIVLRALQRDPQERFQNMRALALALEPFGPKQTVAEAAAGAPAQRSKLGEILAAEGLLTQSDLLRALEEQRRSGKLLGRVLLDLRLVSQVDLLTALAKQQGVIVTPESASPIKQTGAAKALPRGAGSVRRSWRSPWLVAVAAGLPLGIAAAMWLGVTWESRAPGSGLVEAASANALPNLALTPTSNGARPLASAAALVPALAPTPRSARRSQARSGVGTSLDSQARGAFDPSGI
jgi:protein kinase-like protein